MDGVPGQLCPTRTDSCTQKSGPSRKSCHAAGPYWPQPAGPISSVLSCNGPTATRPPTWQSQSRATLLLLPPQALPLRSAYITLARALPLAQLDRTAQHKQQPSSLLQEKRGACSSNGFGERRSGSGGVPGRGGGGRGGAAGRRCGGGGGKQVRRRGAAELGERPHGVRRRPSQAPPRRQLRRRVRVQEQVPVRQGQRRPQARAGGLRRRRHRFLSVFCRGQAQRVRLRVPGQRDRGAIPSADEPVHRRHRQPRAAHRPVVRPHRRLPHLRRSVEPQPGRLHGRRHPHPRLPERHLHHQRPPPPQHHHHLTGVPGAAADGGVQLDLERGRLGDAGWAGQDGLVPRAVRGHVPGGPRRRLRLGGQRHRLRRRRGGAVHRVVVGKRGQVLVEGEGDVGADGAPEPPARVGARSPPRLRLLRRHRSLPRPAARVRRPLIDH